MLAACTIAALSIFLGALLGFSRRATPAHLGPIKTFAFAAAVTVVVVAFIPEAMATLGALALVPLATGFWGPGALELAFRKLGEREGSAHLGLEIGYVGLAVHQLGDGIGMGTLIGPAHETHNHVDVFLAMGAHTVPITAVVVLAFVRAKGRAIAARRAVGLALFVLAGILVARCLGVSIASRWGGVTSALVGGLLLHIAAHDLGAMLPKSTVGRSLDLAAAALGVLIVTVGDREPGEDGFDLTTAASACRRLALTSAPYLFVGVAVAAGVGALLARRIDLGVARTRLPEDIVAAFLAGALLGPAFGCAYFLASIALASVSSRRSRPEGGPHADGHDGLFDSLDRVAARSVSFWMFGVGAAALSTVGLSASRGSAFHVGAAIAIMTASTLGAPIGAVLAASLVGLGASTTEALAALVGGGVIARLRLAPSARRPRMLGTMVGTSALVVATPRLVNRSETSLFGTNAVVEWIALLIVGVFGLRLVFARGARGIAGMLSDPGGEACAHFNEPMIDQVNACKNTILIARAVHRNDPLPMSWPPGSTSHLDSITEDES